MVSWGKLHQIDHKLKISVYGWIRRAELQLHLQVVPLVVSSICILYLHEEEIFEIIGKHITLSKNKKCITLMRDDSEYINYGAIEIDSSRIYKLDLSIYFPIRYGVICVGASNYMDEPFSVYSDFNLFNDIFIAIKRITGSKINNPEIESHASFVRINVEKGITNVSIILDISKSSMRIISKQAKVNQILHKLNNGDIKSFQFMNNDDIKYKLMAILWSII